jgi:hypothetical protein
MGDEDDEDGRLIDGQTIWPPVGETLMGGHHEMTMHGLIAQERWMHVGYK